MSVSDYADNTDYSSLTNFTFGIVTSSSTSTNLQTIVDSIQEEFLFDPHCFEILIVGGNHSFEQDNFRIIPVDESKRKGWITRKKNIITELAKFDQIVYMHDYIKLDKGWYKNFLGMKYDLCMTPIKNQDGTRYRDWTLWPDDLFDILGPWNSHYLLPYDEIGLSKYMYFSGAYWVAKKKVMQEFPLDESLNWGESEDVKWSKQVREKYNFSLNTNSSVSLLKQKDRIFNEITPDMLDTLQKYELRKI